MSSIEDLPSGLTSLWRMSRFAFRHEPWLAVSAFFLALLAALPDAFLALWLKFLGQGVLNRDRTLILVAALGLAVFACATWLLRTVSTRVQRHFRDKLTIALESHVAGLQASIATVTHHERPEYLDRLSVLRDQTFVLDHMYMSFFSTCGWVLRLAVTVALLMSVSPELGLVAVCALPVAVASAVRPRAERGAQERGAQRQRLAKHLFTLMTTPSPAKEIRVDRIGPELARRRRSSWEDSYRLMARARWVSAVWNSAAWAVFGAGYAGSIVFVASYLHAPPASVLLVLAAGSRLSGYVSGTVGEISFLTGIWLDGSRRLAWLEDYAASVAPAADLDPPRALVNGIELDHVAFAYPGTERTVLQDVSLTLPAGTVVAIVGENGAGKTTLVKLLAKMYAPTEGRILVDGVDLQRIETHAWRTRLAGAFQDFFRFELLLKQTVGLGDVARIKDEPAIMGAVNRAGAGDVVARMPSGIQTQLGPTWPDGVDVSFGQWQKLSLARGFMREEPLLMALDEPTAALDAETEHALFESFAGAAKRDGSLSGRITILVSHRFSTVRMADRIIVVDGSRIVEMGSHAELITARGKYAELYDIQASAYA